MNPAEVIAVMESKGAILRGHFKLSSGRHSDVFVQKFRVLEHPRLAQSFGEQLAQRFAGSFDVVASPAVGAVVLGFSVALAADVRFVFAERIDGDMAFRRGFKLNHRDRVLVVEDVITTGGSALEVVSLVRNAGAEPIGVGSLIDRSEPSRAAAFGVPWESLARLEVTSWEAPDCPLCAADEPLSDPGSRRLGG